MTEALLRSTAPVFEIDGQVHGELARDVLHLGIEECTAGMKVLTLRLLAHGPRPRQESEGLLYLDGSVIDLGKHISVSLGCTAEARTLFDGYISAIEVDYEEGREPCVTVSAEDRLMDLRMTRRMKTYTNSSDADIARSIANEHGLRAKIEADGPTYDVVQQWNMSDLAFLRERARLIQAEIWLQGDELHFETRDKRQGTELTLVQGNHLLALSVRVDLAHQRTEVRLSGYDHSERDSISQVANGGQVRSEAPDGKTGPELLGSAFGSRVSQRVREVPMTDEEARAFARAEMLRRARGFVSVEGTARGTPDMVVGSRVSLARVGAPFEGPPYYVTCVHHTYDLERSHRTHFRAERPTLQVVG